MERDLFIQAKGSLPGDYLSRDSEYKGPGWSPSWTRGKDDCSHRRWDSLLIPKVSFHGLIERNGFCDTSNKHTWTTILVQVKGQNHLRVRLDDPCGSLSGPSILWSGVLSPSAAPQTPRSERAAQASRTLLLSLPHSPLPGGRFPEPAVVFLFRNPIKISLQGVI